MCQRAQGQCGDVEMVGALGGHLNGRSAFSWPARDLNTLAGKDPAIGHHKVMRVKFTFNGKPHEVSAVEHVGLTWAWSASSAAAVAAGGRGVSGAFAKSKR